MSGRAGCLYHAGGSPWNGPPPSPAGAKSFAMKPSIIKILVLVTVYSIAMGFFESSLVVYLRALYYPEGFAFPLKVVDPLIAATELCREFATLVMLIVIGAMAGRTKTEKFAFFLFSFAVWDVFYYLFLKIILDWPASLLTWDLLFLLPCPWVGPVLAPVINAMTMIILALLIVARTSRSMHARLNSREWILLLLGSLIVIASYTMEFGAFMTARFSLAELCRPGNDDAVLAYAATYRPAHFSWPLFTAGALMHAAAVALFFFRKIRPAA